MCGVASNGCTAKSAVACSSGTVCDRVPSPACLDADWAQWLIPNGSSDTAAGAPNPEGYTDNRDGTVTDKVTGLMWQQTIPTLQTALTWTSAVKVCTLLTLGGYADWRLPSQTELLSIVDYTIASPGPVINGVAFPAAPSGLFWSATLWFDDSNYAWYIDFNYGAAWKNIVTTTSYVRCVR
jgi:hypothetical protein